MDTHLTDARSGEIFFRPELTAQLIDNQMIELERLLDIYKQLHAGQSITVNEVANPAELSYFILYSGARWRL